MTSPFVKTQLPWLEEAEINVKASGTRVLTTTSVAVSGPRLMIETVLVNRTEGEAMGAGETAVTVTAAAIANAVFDATGVRLRQVPFTPLRVKAALSSSRQSRV